MSAFPVSPVERAWQAWDLAQRMGPSWLAYRLGYSIRARVGWLGRRLPVRPWQHYRLDRLTCNASPEDLLMALTSSSAPRFFISAPEREAFRASLAEGAPSASASDALVDVEQLRLGRYQFFFGDRREVGWPPRWHRHPETGEEWPRIHWGRLPDRGPSDVKWLWELGRFGVVYPLVRAYWLTGSTGPAEIFWELVASWRAANEPNQGVHWMSGQECSVRVLAWCFGLFGLLDAPATTPQRVAILIEMLAAHGERIEGNLGYAISQKNNHGIIEALGLWTLGTVFPMLRSAARWEARGRALLEQEARRQIYEDGSYVQHSVNYQRLMLQSYAWALRLAVLCGRPFSAGLLERFGRAVRLLYEITDGASGRAPNYGSNDGAMLFRLDSCDFTDYRPVLALGFWIAEGRRALEPGPWDESLLWLCGREPLEAPVRPLDRADLAARVGGYYTLRGQETWAFTRCTAYRDRPAQADMLHLDLWWRGVNVVADPGTFSYNRPPPWNNGLSITAAHNTVEVDGLDQMERGPRFTWLRWATGRVVHRAAGPEGRLKLLEGEHDGYVRRARVRHRRAILLVDGRLWVVVDDLIGQGRHRLSSHWLFPDATSETLEGESLEVLLPAGPCEVSFYAFAEGAGAAVQLQLGRADSNTTRGWFSSRYLHKTPALSVIASSDCLLPVRRVTLFAVDGGLAAHAVSPAGLAVTLDTGRLLVEWATLPCPAGGSLLRRATIESARGEAVLWASP